MDCVKNPFLFGVITAIAVYAFFYWKYKKEADLDPSLPRKKVSYLYPLGAGCLAAAFAHLQFPQRTYRMTKIVHPASIRKVQPDFHPIPEIFLDFGTF